MNKKEWQKRNLEIANQMRKSYGEYRKKVCVNCNAKQKKIRDCINIDGETQCNHMIRVVSKRFRKEIYNQLNLQNLLKIQA